MLSVAGVNPDPESKCQAYLNQLMFSWHVVSALSLLIASALSSSSENVYGFLLVMGLGFANLMATIALKSSGTTLSRIFIFVEKCLSRSQKTKLRYISFFMMTSLAVTTLLEGCSKYYYGLYYHSSAAVFFSVNHYPSVVLREIHFLIYSSLCLVLGETMLAHIRSTSRPDLSSRQLEVELNKIKMLIADLNGKISIIPLTWFSYTFASSLFNFVEYQSNRLFEDRFLRLYSIYKLFINLAGVLTISAVVDDINRTLQREYRTQYEAILMSENTLERCLYVNERKNQYALKVKVCGMFDLNMKSILTYFSSLVTFTILFMQLNKVL
ncbi:hypothetical protein HDE_06720 [Halotydeus destructor]|nr:hypothetical protein HDE_06720 [Halotydeus destructor]